MEYEIVTTLFSSFDLTTVFIILIGTVLGIGIGVLPGMGPTVACAIVLPFTIGMEPIDAISLLIAIYCAGTYGGSIAAILINTPGTPAAVATALDGYPLAQRGEAGRALGIATVASASGGIISTVIFVFAAPGLAQLAFQFGPAEYFALTIFGISMLTTIGGDPLKSMISGLLGILLATVGMDVMTGIERFTFGSAHLADGIPFVPIMVGLFAISEFLVQATKLKGKVERIGLSAVQLPKLEDYKQIWKSILRATGIGTFIGILPAEGGTVAAVVAYNEEKRWSPNAEAFGSGAIDGIAAAESANNSATTGAMVPTLALGIPGGATSAVILAGLLMHGLRPGPNLFQEQADLFYGIALAMLLVNIAIIILGLLFARYFARVTLIPVPLLWPSVMIISVIGAYAFHQSMLEVTLMVFAGIAGFFIRRYGFSSIALVIGLVLGQLLETTLRQSMVIFDGNALRMFESPLALLFFFLSIVAVFGPNALKILKRILSKNR